MKKLRLPRIAWSRVTPVVLTVLLTAYLVVALRLTAGMAAADPCTGVDIVVRDTSAHPFVTARELNRDLGNITYTALHRPLSQIDTYAIEDHLRSIDKVETATVVKRTDGRLLIDVTPMRPVARIFDGERSYYINKDGKRITANARYHVDVPVIVGRFDLLKMSPDSLLPLMDYIQADPTWSALVSAVKVDTPRDVLLVPVIRGHVINLGDTRSLDDKFTRLRKFYTRVMPHTGWSRYDTISLKWRGQVVATRAHKGLGAIPDIKEDIDEADDATTMLPTDDALAIREAEKEKAKNKTL